jgi:hypothetical protein
LNMVSKTMENKHKNEKQILKGWKWKLLLYQTLTENIIK